MKRLLGLLVLLIGLGASSASAEWVVHTAIPGARASLYQPAPGAESCVYTRVFVDEATGNMVFVCALPPPETCSQLVTRLYREILLRDPDSGGLAYWTARCEAGETETQLRAELEPYRP